MFSSTVSTVVSLGTVGDPPPLSYHQRSSMMGQATLSQIQTYVGTDTYSNPTMRGLIVVLRLSSHTYGIYPPT